MQFKTRFIEDDILLEDFRQKFVELSGNPVDNEYLQAVKIRGFFKNGDLVAGYVINKHLPLRYFSWLPKKDKETIVNINVPGGEANCCEITCIWKNQQVVSRWETNWIYIVAIYDGLLSRKGNILGGTFDKSVANGQMRILSNLIYSGPSDFRGGELCNVYYATRKGALVGIVREFFNEVKRDMKKNKRRKNIRKSRNLR